ncbi:MAG: flagellar biosynthesis anti-sigma factor FlgM, partial [Proteobacteria bacterium]|nr:flagellar biosynthesis anti-sigma factor FlgM [Pseudomonadota bacterium]
QSRAATAADPNRSVSGDATASRGATDRVELSDSAKSLQSLAHEIADLPAVDAARVDSIRRAITEGRYHVDPARLAQKFLELEGDL